MKLVINRMSALCAIVKLWLWWPIVVLMPRDHKKIIFGAWCGKQFSDNPKYFLKYIKGLGKGFKCYWFGDEQLRSKVETFGGVKFVKKDSLLSIWHMLTASWIVSNLGADCDVSMFPTYGKVKLLTFWHGTSFKGLRHVDRHMVLSEKPLRRMLQKFTIPEFNIARPLYGYASFSYEDMRYRMPMEVPWQFRTEMSIAAGTARIDYLVINSNNSNEKRRVKNLIASRLEIPADKRWYLYMPTWREDKKVNYSFSGSRRLSAFNSILSQQNAILIEKRHPAILRACETAGGWFGNVFVVSLKNAELDIDTQELLLASDRLITDYSSCFCDFEVMNRPVIHYAYDYAEFGVGTLKYSHDLIKVAAGPISYDESQLEECLAMTDEELLNRKGENSDYLISGEKGHASESLAKWSGLI